MEAPYTAAEGVAGWVVGLSAGCIVVLFCVVVLYAGITRRKRAIDRSELYELGGCRRRLHGCGVLVTGETGSRVVLTLGSVLCVGGMHSVYAHARISTAACEASAVCAHLAGFFVVHAVLLDRVVNPLFVLLYHQRDRDAIGGSDAQIMDASYARKMGGVRLLLVLTPLSVLCAVYAYAMLPFGLTTTATVPVPGGSGVMPHAYCTLSFVGMAVRDVVAAAYLLAAALAYALFVRLGADATLFATIHDTRACIVYLALPAATLVVDAMYFLLAIFAGEIFSMARDELDAVAASVLCIAGLAVYYVVFYAPYIRTTHPHHFYLCDYGPYMSLRIMRIYTALALEFLRDSIGLPEWNPELTLEENQSMHASVLNERNRLTGAVSAGVYTIDDGDDELEVESSPVPSAARPQRGARRPGPASSDDDAGGAQASILPSLGKQAPYYPQELPLPPPLPLSVAPDPAPPLSVAHKLAEALAPAPAPAQPADMKLDYGYMAFLSECVRPRAAGRGVFDDRKFYEKCVALHKLEEAYLAVFLAKRVSEIEACSSGDALRAQFPKADTTPALAGGIEGISLYDIERYMIELETTCLNLDDTADYIVTTYAVNEFTISMREKLHRALGEPGCDPAPVLASLVSYMSTTLDAVYANLDVDNKEYWSATENT